VIERPRYLLDTEVLLRAWRNDGPARELVQLGMMREFSLCTSTTILDEAEEVLARPTFAATGAERQALRRTVLLAADDVAVFREDEAPRRSRDAGGDHVVEAALRTRAHVVVSRNERDLVHDAYVVRDAVAACRQLRAAGPYGDSLLLDRDQQKAQQAMLADTAHDGNVRVGADEQVRAITEALEYERAGPEWRFTALNPADGSRLVRQLVSTCGMGLVFDAANGDNFDYVSGIRVQAPGRGGMLPVDVIWYSSDRAQSEALEQPGTATIADLAWTDEARYRFLLAGVLVLVVEHPGPLGEPDMRFVIFVNEPLAPVPPSATAYRHVRCRDARIDALAVDPAGFVAGIDVWIAGGPGGLVSPTSLDHRGVDRVFVMANAVADRLGWPTAVRARLHEWGNA
jgi:predicted nucleic acid-binding protein